MFSGIVEELGRVKKAMHSGRNMLLEVVARLVLEGTKPGDSISVNGACLTVVKISADSLSFEVMPQTFNNSNLGSLRAGDAVNLERSLKVGERISGHFVTGHVDCIGIVRSRSYKSGNLCFEICVAREGLKYVVPKGSISIDGISLTVAEKKASSFCVYVIPHTLKNTILDGRRVSSKVNVEFDILMKKP